MQDKIMLRIVLRSAEKYVERRNITAEFSKIEGSMILWAQYAGQNRKILDSVKCLRKNQIVKTHYKEDYLIQWKNVEA
jgi:hypothetical protein